MAQYIELKKQFQPQPTKSSRWKNNFYIIIICIAISTTFWIITVLSKEYETTISIPIQIVDIPNNYSLSGYIPENLFVKAKLQGFSILRHKYLSAFNQMNVSVADAEKFVEENKIRTYYIKTKTLTTKALNLLGKNVSIHEIWPDVLKIKAEPTFSKKIPVIVDYFITNEKKTNRFYYIYANPDSVYVFGPKSIIDTINYVRTEKIELKNVTEDLIMYRKLDTKPFKNILTFSQNDVKIELIVDHLTENSIIIPIEVINVQKGYQIKLMPDNLKVIFNVTYKNYDKINENTFKCVVDFNKLKNASEYVKPEIIHTQKIAKIKKIIPDKIYFVIEEDK